MVWSYAGGGGSVTLYLRTVEEKGFARTASFSLVYALAEDTQEQDARPVVRAALVHLRNMDQGQWLDAPVCDGVSPSHTGFIPAPPPKGKPVSTTVERPAPGVKAHDLIAVATPVLLVVLLLWWSPAAWRWLRRQPPSLLWVAAGLVVVAVVLRMSPALVLDEYFYGLQRVEIARALPVHDEYYPAGLQALLWWVLRVVPSSLTPLFVLNRALGCLAVVWLAMAAWRWWNARGGLAAGWLMALLPYPVLLSVSDTDAAAAGAATALFLLALSVRGRGAWPLQAVSALWMVQQRVELVVLLPLLVFGVPRRRLVAAGAVLVLHLPFLLSPPVLEKFAQTGMVNAAKEFSALSLVLIAPFKLMLMSLVVQRHAGLVFWPWMAVLVLALVGTVSAWRRGDRRAAGVLAVTVVLLSSYVSHGANHPTLGELTYLIHPFVPLVFLAGAAVAFEGKREMMMSVVMGLVAGAGWVHHRMLRPPPTVEEQTWAFVQQVQGDLGNHCTLVLPPVPSIRDPDGYVVQDFAPRPLLPLTWRPDGCTLLTWGQYQRLDAPPKNAWLYLGPGCFFNTGPAKGESLACRAVHPVDEAGITTEVRVDPRLFYTDDPWPEPSFTIGFYPLTVADAPAP